MSVHFSNRHFDYRYGHVDKRLSSLFTPNPVSKMLGSYPNKIYKNIF